MSHYKDRTYCSSEVDTHTCGREIELCELEEAEQLGLLIAYGDFCNLK